MDKTHMESCSILQDFSEKTNYNHSSQKQIFFQSNQGKSPREPPDLKYHY